MQYRTFGNSGLELSLLGLGTTKFGRNEGVKFPTPFEIPEDLQLSQLLDIAHDLGINLLDTAPAYGNAEERIGNLLKNKRRDWIISTKVGEEFSEGVSFYNFTPEHAQKSINRSLKNLKTDYLDIVLVHSDGNDIHNIQHYGILDFLLDLKMKGILRAVGMSTKTVEGGLLTLSKADVAMITYNPLHTSEKPIIDYAYDQNKGILIKKALASGHLDQISTVDPILASFEFILREPGVTSIVLGTINAKHLVQNTKTLLNAYKSSQ